MKTMRLIQAVSVVAVFGVGAWVRGSQPLPVVLPPAAFDAGLHLPPHVESLLRRSCADCHSEATRWPWYAEIPPASWLVHRDVEHARGAMNLSKWSDVPSVTEMGLLTVACADVQSKRMPPSGYLLMHPSARLAPKDVQEFCAWAGSQTSALLKQAQQVK